MAVEGGENESDRKLNARILQTGNPCSFQKTERACLTDLFGNHIGFLQPRTAAEEAPIGFAIQVVAEFSRSE